MCTRFQYSLDQTLLIGISGVDWFFFFIVREAREIMYLEASVRPSVSFLTAEPFDLRPWYSVCRGSALLSAVKSNLRTTRALIVGRPPWHAYHDFNNMSVKEGDEFLAVSKFSLHPIQSPPFLLTYQYKLRTSLNSFKCDLARAPRALIRQNTVWVKRKQTPKQ